MPTTLTDAATASATTRSSTPGAVTSEDAKAVQCAHSPWTQHSLHAPADSRHSLYSPIPPRAGGRIETSSSPSSPPQITLQKALDSNSRLSPPYDATENAQLANPSSPTTHSPNGHARWRPANQDSSASSPSSIVSGSPDFESSKKRTASGNLKLQYAASANSYQHQNSCSSYSPVPSHSRNTSINSTASSVSELSLQLKSRLTHAMIRLQREKESPHISATHVEDFTPVKSLSPTLPTSQLPYQTASGAVKSSPQTYRDFSSAVDRPLQDYQRNQPLLDHQRFPINQQISERRLLNHGTPSLAPAPEIISSSSSNRRTNSLHAKPPTLSTSRSSRTPTSITAPHATGTPSTPTPQEQDAVDTLLFMSSPANSAHFPRASTASAQVSPRRSHFMPSVPREYLQPSSLSAEGTMTPTQATQTSISNGSDPDSGIHRVLHGNKRRSLGLNLTTENDVDNLLDQMAESRSVDEEDQAEMIRIPRSTAYMNGSLLNIRS